MVHSIVPLAVLEAVRNLDTPVEDGLSEFAEELLVKRLGLSRTVQVQLAEYEGLQVCEHTHGELGLAAAAGHHEILTLRNGVAGHQQTAYLMEHEAGTHKEILEHVPVSPSTLSHHLKKMQLAGLIDRATPAERGYQVTEPKAVARLMATYELATPDQIDTFLRVWGEFRL